MINNEQEYLDVTSQLSPRKEESQASALLNFNPIHGKARRLGSASYSLVMTPVFFSCVLLVGSIVLLGCSSVVSDSAPTATPTPVAIDGLPYRLPEGLVHIVGSMSKAGDATSYGVTTSVIYQADAKSRTFYARRLADYASDDSIRSEITITNELLTSTAATNTDEVPQIISSVASMVGQMAPAPAPPPSGVLKPFDLIFDPDNVKVKDANGDTIVDRVHAASGLILTVTDMQPTTLKNPVIPDETAGLLYRPLKAYQVKFSGIINGGPDIESVQYVLVPNKNLVYYIPFNPGLCT